VAANPSYVPALASSFWTYQLIIDCTLLPGGVKSIAIPIGKSIKKQLIKVTEKIGPYNNFQPVDFLLSKRDPAFGLAPAGYHWLVIENSGRYCHGLSVVYQLEILGDYKTEALPGYVKTMKNVIPFGCPGPLVPKCAARGALNILHSCSAVLDSRPAVLIFTQDICNSGTSPLKDVQYYAVIQIPSELEIGAVTVSPAELSADTSAPGKITITGNLGTIAQGQTLRITSRLPVIAVAKPKRYAIPELCQSFFCRSGKRFNVFIAAGSCELSVQKCCRVIENNRGNYRRCLNVDYSPDTAVNLEDRLSIPAGVTIRFNDFGVCGAVFFPTETQFPLEPISQVPPTSH
jgi:hypothetical protein